MFLRSSCCPPRRLSVVSVGVLSLLSASASAADDLVGPDGSSASVNSSCANPSSVEAALSVVEPGGPPRSSCSSESCVDLASDPNLCGSCDSPRDESGFCSHGVCSESCDSELSPCGQSSVGLSVDPLHCGGCSVADSPGQSFESSECVGASDSEANGHVNVVPPESTVFRVFVTRREPWRWAAFASNWSVRESA